MNFLTKQWDGNYELDANIILQNMKFIKIKKEKEKPKLNSRDKKEKQTDPDPSVRNKEERTEEQNSV